MRFLRFLLWAVGALVCAVMLLVGSVYVLSARTLAIRYADTGNPVALTSSPQLVSEGRHLATIRGCIACHGEDGGGAFVINDPAMGRVYAPNLTPGKNGHGATLTAADWERAIREGVAPDGHGLVIMPSKDFAGLSDADTAALIAYYQSLPAVDRADPGIDLGPVARGLIAFGKMKLSAQVIAHTHRGPMAPVPIGITPAYGRYLASSCTGCHNPAMSGGKIVEGPPNWPPAANLTPGTGSVITGWTEADFIRTLRTRKAPNGKAIDPVMPEAFSQLSDVELKAIWSYIQTLPPREFGK